MYFFYLIVRLSCRLINSISFIFPMCFIFLWFVSFTVIAADSGEVSAYQASDYFSSISC